MHETRFFNSSALDTGQVKNYTNKTALFLTLFSQTITLVPTYFFLFLTSFILPTGSLSHEGSVFYIGSDDLVCAGITGIKLSSS